MHRLPRFFAEQPRTWLLLLPMFLYLQLPSFTRRSTVLHCCHGILCGVPPILLPLHDTQGPGGLLSPPPRPAYRTLHRFHHCWGPPTDQFPRWSLQRHGHNLARTLVLPDGLHSIRTVNAGWLQTQGQRHCVQLGGKRGTWWVFGQLPAFQSRPWLAGFGGWLLQLCG